jgi:hypothetical protein
VYLIAKYAGADDERTLIDEATGEEVTLEIRHSLFFIPPRYWPVVLPAIGLLLMLAYQPK